LFFNYAVWETVELFAAAFNQADFQKTLGKYPNSAISSPHLFKRLTVPNFCVDP